MVCRCYCALDDQVTADALERLESIEEKELRSGHLWSLIFGDHDRAQVSHTDMCWQPLSGTVTKPRLMHAATREGTDRDWNEQECFLRSSHPATALNMRMQLQHWPQALSLARELDPALIPLITCRIGQARTHLPCAIIFLICPCNGLLNHFWQSHCCKSGACLEKVLMANCRPRKSRKSMLRRMDATLRSWLLRVRLQRRA